MNLMLGKKNAKFNPYALRMTKYVDVAYVPPAFADNTPYGFTNWGMMLNDLLGICTIAACGHALQVFTKGAITEPDVTVASYYSKWCGYVVGDPATDQGGNEETVLSNWKTQGFAGHVLEGYVEIGEQRTEGPFGDHTGFYSLEDEYPVFHVTCVTHRKHPIYATTIVGPPPMEDFYMGKAIERIFLPLMRLQLPEIRDISMPAEGVFHNLILVSIRKSYPLHARKVMHAIWGLGQAMFSKCIVVVDEDVDVQNVSEVAWKALNNIDPERDIQFVLGPVDSLDHSSRLPNYGSKMGIDATRKWKEEGFVRPWPDVIEMPDEVKQRVNQLWKKAGLG